MASRVLLLTADSAAADDVRRPLERGGMSVTLTQDPGTALQRLGEHQLVIIDAPDEASLALLCRRINDESGSAHPPILAIAHNSDVEARVRLLEAGADDVLVKPIDERELEALVEALLLRAPSPSSTPGSNGGAMVPTRPDGGPGRVIAFASAKGGSGTTTLAVNTALILAENAPGEVALADFDMYHGQVSSHLDVYPRTSTAELARESREELNPEVFQETGRMHSSGLTVFGGPYRPDDAYDISGQQLVSLVEQLRTIYATVVIDVGSVLDPRMLGVLDKADVLALVVTPDIPSLRLLHAGLQMLSESVAAGDKSVFVVNQVFPRQMISGEQIEEHIGIKVGLEIPYDGDGFLKSVNEGQPYVTTSPTTPAALGLRRLAAQLTDGHEPEPQPVAVPARKGRFKGLLNRE